MASEDLAALLVTEFGPRAHHELAAEDAEAFIVGLIRILPDAVRTLAELYGMRTDTSDLVRTLVSDALTHAVARDASLRRLDRARMDSPTWFQDARMIGYVCYADRFASTLRGVRSHLDHLTDLGVTYLHLMPVLKPREGDNDGGYAVADYDAVDPRLGTMDDFTELADALHARGIALCVDVVLNHTAAEHEWARKAARGDPYHRDFYLVYPDRTEPDAYEHTLPDIFPDLAPGSFTYNAELDGWVWTTFYGYQWDLDYTNPHVFRAMLNVMLRMANRGVDVLRLDAVPFLWKRRGTDCMNQPEAHLLLQAFRALTRLAAPGLLLKAEAMVEPDLLGKYLGGHEVYRPECDLAYDNQLMVMLWSAVATGDARLAAQALGRRPAAPASTSWVTYVRCHDDIGWAVSDIDAAAVGLDGHVHRGLLSDFYAGNAAGSFARGKVFQHNVLGESPISGTLASLCGVEAALAGGDSVELELALRRLESMYSVVFSFGGMPLIYMGDEFAMLNDPLAQGDPAHRHDNRWIHRPSMDWTAAERRCDPNTVPGRAYNAVRALAVARARQPSLGASAPTATLSSDDQLLTYRRGVPGRRPVFVAVNVGATPRRLDLAAITAAGIAHPAHLHSTTGSLDIVDGRIELPGCAFVWIGDT